MDVMCLMALLPQLADDEAAISHDLHYALMAPVMPGETVSIEAQVDKRGRNIAFLSAHCYCTKAGEKRLVARGSVTKSIVRKALREDETTDG